MTIVNNTVNDCAMTVLPDAPTDPATGLPVPTIAVATDGGVSVIKDDGTVVDITGSAGASVSKSGAVFFDGNDILFGMDVVNFSSRAHYRITIPDADRTVQSGSNLATDKDFGRDITGLPVPLGTNASNGPIRGANGTFYSPFYPYGVTLTSPNEVDRTKAMVAYTTSTYNTGWMPGDIKLAALSDTDDTDLIGYTAIDDDGSSATGWSDARGNGTVTSTGGRIRSTATAAGAYGPVKTLTGLVVGKQYSYNADVFTGGGSGFFAFRISGNSNLSDANLADGDSDFSATGFFTATNSTMYIGVINVATSGGDYAEIDNVSVKLADEDRSVNANGLIVNNSVTRTAVESGADLVSYSGFSASNYLEQPYNSAFDFGTDEFAIIGWLKQAANTAVETILERDSATTAQRFTLAVNASGFLTFTCDDDTTARTATSNRVVDDDVWTHFVALYDGAGDVKIYLNGVLDDTETGSTLLTLNNASAVLRVGLAVDGAEPLANGSLALLRISATAPTADQILKIYNDEKVLFQDNAQATLYGASDAVTALAHDPVTDLLHVGTSAGRSVFQGLRRVSNTTTAVGTAISASNNLVVEE